MRAENGFGSIVCLDKSGKKRRKPWAVRITVGWKNGKQQRKYLGYYKSQADALVALADYHKNGINVDMSNLTLNEVYEYWMERVHKKGVSDSVLRNHKMARERFGALGNRQIKTIKSAHLQDWLDGIDLKPGSKGKIRSTINQIFEYALKNDILTKNPAKGLEINEKIEYVGKVFTDEEIALLWENRTHEDVRRILILLYTGMRIGEMLKMDRENIQLDEGYMVGGSKTLAGRDRIIPIHRTIVPLIREELGDNKWLVQSHRGVAMAYTTFLGRFNAVLDKYNMEHKIHDTRKTAISWMHSNGVPMETIRKIVGHAAQGVTEQYYLFKSPKELVDIINSLEIPY